MAMNNFLSDFQDKQLKDLIVPGSHDAGLSQFDGWNFQKSLTVTQNRTVGEQANCGSRFFDIRVTIRNGVARTVHQYDPKKLFGDGRRREFTSTGGVGEHFDSVMGQLGRFVCQNRTEFVVARIAHIIDGPGTVDAIQEWMGMNCGCCGQPNINHVYQGFGNIAEKKVGDLSGKVIFLIESIALGGMAEPHKKGFQILHQSKKRGTIVNPSAGLSMCGEYSNSNDLNDIVRRQTKRYCEHDDHKGSAPAHLYCLYWTATKGNIEENTERVINPNFAKVEEMMADMDLKKNSRFSRVGAIRSKEQLDDADRCRLRVALAPCSIPNVIFLDFVDEDKCKKVVSWNWLNMGRV